MREKMTPHIIAVMAFVMFVVLGLACASTPKAPPNPKEIIFDSTIAQNQLATLYIPPGSIEIIEFNGKLLNPKWYQMSIMDGGINVKIPAGKHNIVFHYYGGEYGVNMKNRRLNIDVIAGRTYRLFNILTGYSRSSTSISETVLFTIFEISEKREPGPDEQVFYVKNKSSLAIIIIDKGTVNERLISLAGPYHVFSPTGTNELRIIIPKGEHTIDVTQQPGGTVYEPAGELPRNFTADSEPVRYSIAEKVTGFGANTKITYTLTRE